MSSNAEKDLQLREFMGEVNKGKWIDKDRVLADIVKLIRKTPLTQMQVDELRQAVESRIIYKTCWKCGKSKEQYRGQYKTVDGDLTNKRFHCKDCS